MMVKKFIATCLIFIAIISAGCKKHSVADGTPGCIRHKIESDRNKIGSVEEYEFQGKVVYAFQPDGNVIADGATTVVTNEVFSLIYSSDATELGKFSYAKLLQNILFSDCISISLNIISLIYFK